MRLSDQPKMSTTCAAVEIGFRRRRVHVTARAGMAMWHGGAFVLAIMLLSMDPVAGQTLDDTLRALPAAQLAEAARRDGDAARGAVLFFQPHMVCSKCHTVGDARESTLGPDLATLAKDASDVAIVESVLLPSKVLRKGFDSVTVLTSNGVTLTGILVDRTADALVIRNLADNGQLMTLSMSDIDDVVSNTVSIMPAGQVSQLASQQQFLDLIRYLMEIRDGGAARAKELQPSPALLTLTVPEYEQHLDHAGLIGDWDDDSLQRGEAIYRRVCMNCHGTRDQLGSLPTSLKFAEGKFKNGSDPMTMYQTLTRGFGLMAAQTWMVPSQKYDVIHYIRETYLRPYNPMQLAEVDAAYLARLPKGDTRGPEPSKIETWSAMDYGPSLTHTYQVPGVPHNLAYKGIAMRLDPGAGGVSRGRHWMMFDTDTLRMAAAWSAAEPPDADQNFIDWRGIQFNGEHQIHPHITGRVVAANSTGPGWANPVSGSFADDQRVPGRDGRQYGPLPREWGKFRGQYHHGHQVVLSYSVAETDVLESPSILAADDRQQAVTFLRTFNVGSRLHDLTLQIAEISDAVLISKTAAVDSSVIRFGPSETTLDPDAAVDQKQAIRSADNSLLAGFAPSGLPLQWAAGDGRLTLTIPAGREPLRFTIWTAAASANPVPATNDHGSLIEDPQSLPQAFIANADQDLTPLTLGGPARWTQRMTTSLITGADTGPFATDILAAPDGNPWLAQTRFTGLDFFSDGRAAVSTWDGDVWVVDLNPHSQQLIWQRIASGMFQPLGLKIIKDTIHVTCRDQLAVLHDLNGDGEIDFYECLNNDHQVTEHFHEFAMGLQTDAEGNFYYAKSGRHALKAVVPHHGTLLRIPRDGSRTDILATGFRAANGVCLNPDGSFVVTDQEGFWNPKNRINWVTLNPSGKPKFYGNMLGYTDVTETSDDAMEPPLCWITNAFDRSPGELLWVDSDRWGPLNGSLLNLSYGYGKVFLVPHERVNGVMQGGMIELPLPPFPTGVMRGRFHPRDQQLWLCGMFAWAGSATQPGGLYRLRATGRPMHLPTELHATAAGLVLKFTAPLDARSVRPDNLHVKTWSLRRTANYGSEHYDEKPLVIRGTSLSSDGRTLTLDVADLQPTWCMEIRYSLKSSDGNAVDGVIHNTIHHLDGRTRQK